MEIVIKLVEKKFVEIEGSLFEIPPEAKWVTVDRNGEVFSYFQEAPPPVVNNAWAWKVGCYFIGCTHSVQPDWQNMVMEVPE